MTLLEVFGWIGSLCLAACAAPQAFKTLRSKHTEDLSSLFLILWTTGEVFTLAYVLPTGSTPLIVNYSLNLAFLVIICYYKFIYPTANPKRQPVRVKSKRK